METQTKKLKMAKTEATETPRLELAEIAMVEPELAMTNHPCESMVGTQRDVGLVDKAWCESAWTRVKEWHESDQVRIDAWKKGQEALRLGATRTEEQVRAQALTESLARYETGGLASHPANQTFDDHDVKFEAEFAAQGQQLKHAWSGYSDHIQDQVAAYWQEVVGLKSEIYHKYWSIREAESMNCVREVYELRRSFYNKTKAYPLFYRHRAAILAALEELESEASAYQRHKAKYTALPRKAGETACKSKSKRMIDRWERRSALSYRGDINATRFDIPNVVKGNLLVAECQKLTTLSSDVHVQGALQIVDCDSLIELPANLTVDEFLLVMGCPELTKLSVGLSIGQRLHVRQCPKLQNIALPAKCPANVILDGLKAEVKLPEGFGPVDTLQFIDAEVFPPLPQRLCCVQFISRGADGLKSFPDSSGFEKLIELDLGHSVNMVSMERIPDTLQLLKLTGCSSLECLPQNLEYLLQLDVSSCKKLETIPDSFFRSTPKAPLTLRATGAGVRSLPMKLTNIAQLEMPDGAVELPSDISFTPTQGCNEVYLMYLRLGKQNAHFSYALLEKKDLTIGLSRCGLSEVQADWLVTAEFAQAGYAAKLEVDDDAIFQNHEIAFDSFDDACAFWSCSMPVSESGAKMTLLRFLTDLVDAKECAFTEVRAVVKQKLRSLSTLLNESDAIRSALLKRLCVRWGERVEDPLLVLLELEGIATVTRAELTAREDGSTALDSAQRGLKALRLLHKESLSRTNSGLHALCFEAALEKELALPVLGDPPLPETVPTFLQPNDLQELVKRIRNDLEACSS